MQTVKMVVTGPFNAGKTEFIRAVSENFDLQRLECLIHTKTDYATPYASAMRFSRFDLREISWRCTRAHSR